MLCIIKREEKNLIRFRFLGQKEKNKEEKVRGSNVQIEFPPEYALLGSQNRVCLPPACPSFKNRNGARPKLHSMPCKIIFLSHFVLFHKLIH